MPRPKKIKILETEIPDNMGEILNKMKSLHPDKSEDIDQIKENNNIKDKEAKNTKKEYKFIVVDKVDNFYFDDFSGVWDNNLNLVGAYDNNKKVYLYKDIQEKLKKLLESKK